MNIAEKKKMFRKLKQTIILSKSDLKFHAVKMKETKKFVDVPSLVIADHCN